MPITIKTIPLFFIFISVVALIHTASAAINITDADAIYEANLSSVSVPTTPVPIKTVFVVNADTSSDQNLSSVSVPTKPSPLKEIFIVNEDAALKRNLSTVSIPTEPMPIKEIFIHLEDAKYFEELISPKVINETIFNTGPGTYPSISGTHNGTIKPSYPLTVNKMYTYPCPGTGGHTEYAALYYSNGTLIAEAQWNGYKGDYHNISFNKTSTLEKGVIYNYTIRTGSYPQIIHKQTHTNEYGTITCTKFTDANGKKYDNWVPAIKLFL